MGAAFKLWRLYVQDLDRQASGEVIRIERSKQSPWRSIYDDLENEKSTPSSRMTFNQRALKEVDHAGGQMEMVACRIDAMLPLLPSQTAK